MLLMLIVVMMMFLSWGPLEMFKWSPVSFRARKLASNSDDSSFWLLEALGASLGTSVSLISK